jgi:hypothetical protein
MPQVLEKRVKALLRLGMPKSKAYAIATSSLQKEGVLKKGSQELK